MITVREKSDTIVYMFKNSEKLTLAINCLYKNRSTRFLTSELFKLNGSYYLTVEKRERKNIESVEEFSDNTFKTNITVSILREYGKQLINKNAIKVYGKAFAKYF